MFETTQPTITKTKTSGKAHKSHKESSGRRRGIRIHQAIRRLTMKVARWEKNKAENKKSAIKRVGANAKKPQRLGGKVASRVGWKTEGLKKQLEALNNALVKV